MNKTNQPKLSQCMIVKNEEKNIEAALSWGKGVAAEQIVVDTGSTDRTVEIAERMGAKVYPFTWIDDFAAAKNFAISKANYEWIAFLDADEFFSAEDAKKVLPLLVQLQDKDLDAVLTSWVQLNDAGTVSSVDSQIRIFRNHPDLRYHRRIHEYLAMEGRRNLRFWDASSELSIFHTGYGEAASQKKREDRRNLRLIKMDLEENPEDYELLGYLGNEYESLEEWDSAESAYRKAVSFMPEEAKGVYDGTTSGCVFRLLELLSALPGKEQTELMEFYQWAIAGWPEEGDFEFIMGKYFAVRGDYPAAEKHIRQALHLLETCGNSARSSLVAAKIMEIYELLAMCCFNQGNLQECVKLTAALLKENRYLMTTAILFISSFRRDMEREGKGQQGAAEVAVLLGKSFYDFQQLKDRLFVLRAAMGAGYQELAGVIRGLFTAEELTQVDKRLMN